MSKAKSPLVYHAGIGSNIIPTIASMLALAARYNRPVQTEFNGIKLRVNKRLSLEHVHRQWWHQVVSRSARAEARIPAAEKARLRAELQYNQRHYAALMDGPPQHADQVIPWLAVLLPLVDDTRVVTDWPQIIEILQSCGYVSGQHAGDPAFADGTASSQLKREYLVGQVIEMAEAFGAVHPMLTEWLQEFGREELATPVGV